MATTDATRTAPPVFHSTLEMVGNTPMLQTSRLDVGPCNLFLKMEGF